MVSPTVTGAEKPSPQTEATPLPAPQGVLRWGPVIGFGLLLLVLSRNVGTGIADPDTLWHVLAGDHLRDTWQFSGPDPLSSFTNQPWVLTQWLPELALSLANQWGGLPAVAFLAQLGRLAVCVAVYVACRRTSGPLAATLVTGITVLATAASLSPRPQLVGFALLAVTASAWVRVLSDQRAPWWLVPLTWVWASSHGTWVVGIMLGLATTAGLVLDRKVSVRAAGRLALVPLASAGAALLTPLGTGILTAFGPVRAVSPYIQEWRRPELTDPSTIGLLVLVLVVALGWARRHSLVSWGAAGILLVGVGWGLTYARTVAVGAIIIAPLAAQALDAALGRARPARGREPLVVAGLVLVVTMTCGLLAAGGPDEPVSVPDGTTAALRALPPGAVVYNDDSLGGWLMWTFPSVRQTADTRAELYGPAHARTYLSVMGAEPGWQAGFDEHRPVAALVREDVPLATALQRDRGWTVAARDDGFLLLRP
ncbi:hypothetical protein GCM10009845_35980 [Pedococcus bigeumensis]